MSMNIVEKIDKAFALNSSYKDEFNKFALNYIMKN